MHLLFLDPEQASVRPHGLQNRPLVEVFKAWPDNFEPGFSLFSTTPDDLSGPNDDEESSTRLAAIPNALGRICAQQASGADGFLWNRHRTAIARQSLTMAFLAIPLIELDPT